VLGQERTKGGAVVREVRTPAIPTIDMSAKITSEPKPIASTKVTKLPQSRNRLAAR
jgi:hypothetical protein